MNLLIVFSVHTKFVKFSQENSTSILYNIQKFYFQTSFLIDPSIWPWKSSSLLAPPELVYMRQCIGHVQVRKMGSNANYSVRLILIDSCKWKPACNLLKCFVQNPIFRIFKPSVPFFSWISIFLLSSALLFIFVETPMKYFLICQLGCDGICIWQCTVVICNTIQFIKL